MARTKPPEQRRADLLDAAQAVFVEKGVAATTLEEITTRAGVAKGTFYLYFRSKDDIVAALQERFAERFAVELRTAADREVGAAKLDAVVQAWADTYAAEVELHDVLFHHAPPYDPTEAGPPSQSTLVVAIGEVLAEGVGSGLYRIDDVDFTAMALYCTLHGLSETSWSGGARPSGAVLVRSTQQLVRRVVGLVDDAPTATSRTSGT